MAKKMDVAAQVTLEADHVRVTFPTAGRVLALRKEVVIPYSCILTAAATRGVFPGPLVLRVGTHWPGGLALGTFWRDGAKRFLYFRKGERVLRLDLERHEFESVEVAAANPDELALGVRERVAGKVAG